MTDWMIWFALAGILVMIEIFTGTFYVLMIAISFAVGGVVAVIGMPFYVQVIIAGIAGGSVTFVLHQGHFFKSHRINPQKNPSVLLDIGQTIEVLQWRNPQGELYRSRASYRGAMWDVELLPTGKPEMGMFIIREIRGAMLLVDNAQK